MVCLRCSGEPDFKLDQGFLEPFHGGFEFRESTIHVVGNGDESSHGAQEILPIYIDHESVHAAQSIGHRGSSKAGEWGSRSIFLSLHAARVVRSTAGMSKQSGERKKKREIPTVSDVLDDGTIIELIYDRALQRTNFALYNAGRWTIQPHFDHPMKGRLIPFSPTNNLIANAVVLFPSEPRIYGSEQKLFDEIRSFIHRYADLSPNFEQVGCHYVLLSWLYDAFDDLPYLRLRGDFGTGKTRTLLTIGSLCYKPFFASGASTVSPIFHTLDAFRGTLIFDEADFSRTDERSELVKILNNGNVKGLPVLRTMRNHQQEFNPRAFHVFGPKIVAMRRRYDDSGLESRFITEDTGARALRADVPINLPPSFKEEARELRDKLLLYRFHRRHDVKIDTSLEDASFEPRLNQIMLPLLSVVSDPSLLTDLRSVARDAQATLAAERRSRPEAQILEIVAALLESANGSAVPVGEVAARLAKTYGPAYDRPITNRWIGSILRNKLNLHTYKSHGVYVLPVTDSRKVEMLCRRYGIRIGKDLPEDDSAGDLGTLGTASRA